MKKPLDEIRARLDLAYNKTYNSTNWKEQGQAELAFLNAAPTDIARLLKALEKCIEQRNGYMDNYHAICRPLERLAIKQDDDAELSRILKGEPCTSEQKQQSVKSQSSQSSQSSESEPLQLELPLQPSEWLLTR